MATATRFLNQRNSSCLLKKSSDVDNGLECLDSDDDDFQVEKKPKR